MHDEPILPQGDHDTVSSGSDRANAGLHIGKIKQFGAKLDYLLKLCGVDQLEFVGVLAGSGEPGRTRKRAVQDPAGSPAHAGPRAAKPIDRRTALGWFDKDVQVQRPGMEKILGFFADRGLPLQSGDFYCEYNDFIQRADKSFEANSKQVRLRLAGSLGVLDEDIVKYLVGKHLMFRYSFDNTNTIVSEIGVIGQSGTSRNMLTFDVYAPPSSGRAVKVLSDAEHFVGNLFQFGEMFYAAVSIAKGSERMRFYQFPKLKFTSFVHLGITSGYSVKLAGEPVATRMITAKIRDGAPLTDNEASLIARNELGSEMAASFEQFVDNTVVGPNAHILKVNQTEVVRARDELLEALKKLLTKARAKKA